MDSNILKIGGSNLIDCIIRQMNLESGKLKLVSASENFVYEYKEDLILRVSPISHRHIEEVYAELEWIEYLNKNGIPAARAVTVNDNKTITTIESHDEKFYAVFFEMAKGRKLIVGEGLPKIVDIDESFYKIWGRTLGRMHKVSKAYSPSKPEHVRKQWYEVIPKLHREEDSKVYSLILDKQRKMIKYLNELPKDVDSYGIIHSDFSYDNFFIHNSEIYPFDFDHCKYHWFVYDIAILLDSARYLPRNGMDEKTYMKCFFKSFMEGYQMENTLNEFWINQIPEFTKLWKLDNFIPIINKADYESLETWEKRMFAKMRRDIENEIAYFILKE